MKSLQCLIIILFTYTCTLQAQDYPVTVSTQIIPPYSLYLPDYYTGGNEKLRVILLQRDLTQPSYDVTLQMTLERNGTVIMRTLPSYHPPAITLSAGVPVIISGAALADYFAVNNVLFSGSFSHEEYERTRSLPEGAYRLSFQAYDLNRPNIQISNAVASVFFLQKSDPPLLNLPICGSRVEKREPQFLTFNWSNRNTSQANTSYNFSLYEIKPANSNFTNGGLSSGNPANNGLTNSNPGNSSASNSNPANNTLTNNNPGNNSTTTNSATIINPDYIIRSTRPLYTTTTENTTILYGPAEPALIDGMQYVWIVQAVDREGKDLYSNQGFSQSCTFTYLGSSPFEPAQKPVLYGIASNQRQICYHWSDTAVDGYRLQYRAVTKDNITYDWQTIELTNDTTTLISSLEPDREYEAHLQWKLSGVYSSFSDLLNIKTPSLKSISCGDATTLTLPSNRQVQPTLIVGNIIRIGHYEVLLTSLSGGRIITPGLGFGLEVVFRNIVVNTDLVAISGEMHAVTKGIDQFIKEELGAQHGGDDMGKVKTGDLIADITTHLHIFTKESIVVDTSSHTITLTDSKDGSKQTIHYNTLPLLLEDADGTIYQITPQGTVNYVGKRNIALAADITRFNNLQLSSGRVDFSAGNDNKYAFDVYNADYPSSYESLANGQYRVSAKAIIPGVQETIIAHRSDTAAVLFVNGKGIVLPSSCTGPGLDCKVTITGGPAGDAQEVYAIHPDGTSIGKLLIPSYRSLQKKVILIPVSDNITIPESAINQTLASVYGSIGISYTLEIDNSFKNNKSWDLNQDGVLQDSKSALLSNGFTGEERAMKKAYTQSHHIVNDAVYLFIVNEIAREDVGLLGKMPRKSQFGFVWVKNGSDLEVGRTVAHEIGHGAYTLEHVVNSFNSSGHTSNISSGSFSGSSSGNTSNISSGSFSGSSSGNTSSTSSGSFSGSSSGNISNTSSATTLATYSGGSSEPSLNNLSSNLSGNDSGSSPSSASSPPSSSLSGSSPGNSSNTPSGNLMSTGTSLALYKFQWDIVHDPGTVWGIFEDDAASELTKGLSLYKCLKKEAQSACTSPLYYAPDSTVVKLPKGAIPLSAFYDDLGTTRPAKPGSLNSFEYAGKEYSAVYYVSNGKFKGYSYEKYDSSTYIYSHPKQAGDKINVIEFDKELFTCAVKVNNTPYPNDGCLCQNNFLTQQYKRYMKEVIGSDQPAVQAEIAAICKTIFALPEDVLGTNRELFTCYYENQDLYYIDWNESPDVFTFDQLKKMHQQFKELDSSIQLLKRCDFPTGNDLVKFINTHFVVPGTKTSYLSRAPFTRLSPETRACLISKLLSGSYNQRWSAATNEFGGQNIMLEIISNCPNSADLYKVIKILEKDHLLYTLLSDTYDYLYVSEGNFTQLCKAITVAVLDEEKPGKNLNLFRQLRNEKKWLIFDDGYLTVSNKEAFRDVDQKIELEVRDGMAKYLMVVSPPLGIVASAILVANGKVNPFYGKFNPLDYVIIIPKREIKAYGTTFQKGAPYVLPAISVYQLFKMDTKSAMETSAALVLNTGLCAIGMEGLTTGEVVLSGWEILNVSLSDFITYANAAPELVKDHPEFVEYANYLALAYTVGTLAVGTAKGIKNARINVPMEMMEAMIAEDAKEISKRIVMLKNDEARTLNIILNKMNDKRVYVAVYQQENNKIRVIINGVEQVLENNSLVHNIIKNAISEESEIVMLTAQNLETAQKMANFLNRPIICNVGAVEVYDNGVIEAEYGCRLFRPNSTSSEIVRVGVDAVPKGAKVVLGELLSAEELATSIFNNIKGVLKIEEETLMWFSKREMWQIVKRGKELALARGEIEDMIFNACDRKIYSVNDMIAQMEKWALVKSVGYPSLFGSLEDFKEFGDLLKGLAKEWGLPEESIYVQGSALRIADKDQISDLDITIRVSNAEFTKLVNRFESFLEAPKMVKQIGQNGKIGGTIMFKSNDRTTSFTKEFNLRFNSYYSNKILNGFDIKKVQISIIAEGSILDLSPYLKL